MSDYYAEDPFDYTYDYDYECNPDIEDCEKDVEEEVEEVHEEPSDYAENYYSTKQELEPLNKMITLYALAPIIDITAGFVTYRHWNEDNWYFWDNVYEYQWLSGSINGFFWVMANAHSPMQELFGAMFNVTSKMHILAEAFIVY